MQYRDFGATDLKPSVLGIGGSHFGSFLANRGEKEIISMIQEAEESGVNFFDTSDIYGQGDSEKILGKALRGKRDQVIIETKAGNCFSEAAKAASRFKAPLRAILKRMTFLQKKVLQVRASQLSQNFEPSYLEKAVNASLRRLQTDYIDVFMLHSPPSEVIEKGVFFDLMDQLKKAGKIRYFGVSCDTGDDALLCLNNSAIDAIQIPVNSEEQFIINNVLPIADSQKVGIVARSPFGSGSLIQNTSPELTTSEFKNDLNVAQSALLKAASYKGVSVVLTGISNRRHLRENLLPFTR